MSRSNAPLQATIDKWCNAEAVNAYADRLDAWADQLSPMYSHDLTTQNRDDAIALRQAANQLRTAAATTAEATTTATNHAYDRLYGRVTA